MSVKPRKALAEVRPYIPGKPIEELKRELGIKGEIQKLASNENPIGPSPKAIEAIKKELGKTNIYPDNECFYLKKGLMKHLDVGRENLIVGNGSVELIMLTAMAYLSPEDEFIAGNRSFALAKISVKLMGAKFKGIPERDYTHNLDAIKDAITDNTKIIYIDNPANPLGTKIPKEKIGNFICSVPDNIIIILDEAYYEFVEKDQLPDSIKFVKQGKNVLVLRTFAKMYGLAGLRIGYGIASPEIIQTVGKARLPFNVNRFAQAAALAALDDEEHIRRTLKVNKEGKEYLTNAFEEMGISYIPSSTNFITFKIGKDAQKVFMELQKRGIIIRPLANYGMAEFLRVTIGRSEQNKLLVETLKKIV